MPEQRKKQRKATASASVCAIRANIRLPFAEPGSQEDERRQTLPLIVCVQAAHRVNNSPVPVLCIEKVGSLLLIIPQSWTVVCVSLYFVISVPRPSTDGLMFHHQY